ncbi:MAG: response regulator receiver protein [Myxococcales bacterium]|nr:response regulator receiver protein [Myxococcales bacterium]
MKVVIFDDVLVRRAPEYERPDLELKFFPHADDAVDVVRRERPDVVLMDYSMDDHSTDHASGEDAIRALRAAFPRNGTKIVAISSDPQSNDRMLAVGADDAVPKTHVKAYLSRLAKLKLG